MDWTTVGQVKVDGTEPPIFSYDGAELPPPAELSQLTLDEQLEDATVRLAKAKHSAAAEATRKVDPQRVRAFNLHRDGKWTEMQDALQRHERTPDELKNKWRIRFFSELNTLLREIIFTAEPSVRLHHLDRTYDWFRANRRGPNEVEPEVPRQPPPFSTFCRGENLPGAAHYGVEEADITVADLMQNDRSVSPQPGFDSARGTPLPSARQTPLPSARSATPRGDPRLSARRPGSARSGRGTPGLPRPTPHLTLSKMARGAMDDGRPMTPSTTAPVSSRPGTALSSRTGGGLSSRPGTALSSRTADLSSRSVMSARSADERLPIPAEFSTPARSPEEEMDLLWLARRHEEIVTKERLEDQHQLMRDWEKRRAQVEEESMRGQEATRFTSVAARRVDRSLPPESRTKPKVVDVSTVGAPEQKQEDSDKRFTYTGRLGDIDQLRDFRRLNRHLFGDGKGGRAQSADVRESFVGEDEAAAEFTSLSPYYEFQGPNAPVSQFKQRIQEELCLQNISKIWNDKHSEFAEKYGSEHVTPTLESIRRGQLEELDAVKRCLGSNNIPCNAAVLERALVMPPQQYRPDVGFGGTVPRLLINPFYDPEGGTKKKGRKGGKKKR
jgi:hypothetical protein